MTMRRLLLALMVFSSACLCAQAPAPTRMYRWKDAKGKLYITTTPPPPGAIVLGMPPELNTKAPDTAKPPPGNGPVKLAAPPNQSLSEAQRGFWQSLAQNLGDARAKGDRAALEATADSIFQDSFWGNGIWVLPAIPAASLLLLVLLGWLIAAGFRGARKAIAVVFFILLGLLLADLSLIQFVFKTQFQRLGGNLALLQLNLGGGKTLTPDHKEDLDNRMKALEAGASLAAPPWKFPAEAQSLRATLREMVVDP